MQDYSNVDTSNWEAAPLPPLPPDQAPQPPVSSDDGQIVAVAGDRIGSGTLEDVQDGTTTDWSKKEVTERSPSQKGGGARRANLLGKSRIKVGIGSRRPEGSGGLGSRAVLQAKSYKTAAEAGAFIKAAPKTRTRSFQGTQYQLRKAQKMRKPVAGSAAASVRGSDGQVTSSNDLVRPGARSIAAGAQEMRVKRMNRQMETAASRVKAGGSDLPTLGGSANPVALTREEFMIPVKDLQPVRGRVVANKQEASNALKGIARAAYQGAQGTDAKREVLQHIQIADGKIVALNDLADDATSVEAQTAFEQAVDGMVGDVDKSIKSLQELIKMNVDEGLPPPAGADAKLKTLNALKAELQKLQPTEIKATPLYDREAIVSGLRVHSQPIKTSIQPGDDELQARDLGEGTEWQSELLSDEGGGVGRVGSHTHTKAAVILSRSQDSHISLEDLKEAGIEDPEAYVDGLGLEPQVSFMEAASAAGYNKQVVSALMEHADLELAPGFAFKAQRGRTGVENHNEMRVQDHMALRGGNQYIAMKTRGQLTGGTIKTGKGTRFVQPKGIVSEFLSKGKPMDSVALESLGAARQALALKRTQGQVPSDEELQALQEVENAAMEEVSARSVIQHGMDDLEFFAGDNHPEQYMIVDGDLINIDYARLNPPGEAEVRMNPVTKKMETYSNLKSSPLDHPHSQKTEIPADMVDAFLARDLDAEEMQLREHGMIGDSEFYELAAARMQDHETDCRMTLFKANSEGEIKWTYGEPSNADLKRLGDKYGVDLGVKIKQELTVPEKCAAAQQLMKAISKENAEFKAACMDQDHPKGHDLRKVRAGKMQEYLSGCRASGEKPTVQGMQDYVLQDTLTPILTVYARINPLPSTNIGINHDFAAHKGGPISLEQIIRDVEAADPSVATDEEINAMKAALATIREGACSVADMRTVAGGA